MANTTVDYTSIRRQVGRYLGLKANAKSWTPQHQELVDDIIRRGLEQYYNPPFVEPNIIAYEWSFLRPSMKLPTVAGQRRYALPPTFESFTGNITFDERGNAAYPPLKRTSSTRLAELEVLEDYQSVPVYNALEPIFDSGQEQQRWVLVLHPTPDAVYYLVVPYVAQQYMLSDENPYPLGGPVHAGGVLASCMAIAEMDLEGAQGIHYSNFMQRLQANIFHDVRRGPRLLGYNGNKPRSYPNSRAEARRLGLVVFGNTTYDS